jgi:hypothetical protein
MKQGNVMLRVLLSPAEEAKWRSEKESETLGNSVELKYTKIASNRGKNIVNLITNRGASLAVFKVAPKKTPRKR